ncbi:MAG: hypothetical protein JXR48_18135 [Candidatus Delongbacteria bacterium]|nr:hypothetical protein [Candidatus Delongbacteria bacterium]MBN2836880.1 hypothetical protein [Candidatus Delongbacteria bacterium]
MRYLVEECIKGNLITTFLDDQILDIPDYNYAKQTIQENPTLIEKNLVMNSFRLGKRNNKDDFESIIIILD